MREGGRQGGVSWWGVGAGVALFICFVCKSVARDKGRDRRGVRGVALSWRGTGKKKKDRVSPLVLRVGQGVL